MLYKYIKNVPHKPDKSNMAVKIQSKIALSLFPVEVDQ